MEVSETRPICRKDTTNQLTLSHRSRFQRAVFPSFDQYLTAVRPAPVTPINWHAHLVSGIGRGMDAPWTGHERGEGSTHANDDPIGEQSLEGDTHCETVERSRASGG